MCRPAGTSCASSVDSVLGPSTGPSSLSTVHSRSSDWDVPRAECREQSAFEVRERLPRRGDEKPLPVRRHRRAAPRQRARRHEPAHRQRRLVHQACRPARRAARRAVLPTYCRVVHLERHQVCPSLRAVDARAAPAPRSSRCPSGSAPSTRRSRPRPRCRRRRPRPRRRRRRAIATTTRVPW